MLTVRALYKAVSDGDKRQEILTGLDMQLAKGESLAVTGDSGSGKSTLLNLIASLDKPDSGEIRVEQQDISQFSDAQANNYRKSQIGFVFQQFNLIDCINVYDNIAFPARLNRCYQAGDITDIMYKLGLSRHQKKLPNQLSGGEQQRVAIARALVHRPKFILADEPTGNLDINNSEIISDLLFGLCQDLQTSLLIVTHSINIAEKATRHLRLSGGKLAEYQEHL